MCDVFYQGTKHTEEGTKNQEAQSSDRHTERSLEESRKLILEWADELRHVDKVSAHARGRASRMRNYSRRREDILLRFCTMLMSFYQCGVRSF